MSTPRDRKNKREKCLHKGRGQDKKASRASSKKIDKQVKKDIDENWETAKANLGSNQL